MLSAVAKVLIYLVFLTLEAVKPTTSISNNPSNEVIRYVGSLDGKAFFAISNLSDTNWEEAGSLCQSKGMSLAELITLEQADLITASYEAGYIPCCNYWTAGRDAYETRQYSWNSTKSNVNGSGVNIVHTPNYYISCLAYEVDTQKVKIMQCLHWTKMILCELKMRQI